eukprot:8852530-Alexandrium_andersonii.AAC.1
MGGARGGPATDPSGLTWHGFVGDDANSGLQETQHFMVGADDSPESDADPAAGSVEPPPPPDP